MGYSIRDDRWRLTLWRERNGSKIVARELYDEQFVVKQIQQVRNELGAPFPNTVNRLTGNEQITDQHQQGSDGGKFDPGIIGRQVPT